MLMLTVVLAAAGALAPLAAFAAPAAPAAKATQTVSTGKAAGKEASGKSLEARRKVLSDLIAEQWEYTLSHSPELASILGDKRWNDQISDFSQKAIDSDLIKTRKFLVRFEAIDITGFPEQEVLNQQLMIRNLREQLDSARFKEWEMPVTQISGIHLQLAQFPPALSFKTAKDYTDLTTRYRKVPTAFDQTIALMRQGMADHLMPPRFLLDKVVTQTEGLAKQDAESSPFAQPVQKFPPEIPAAEQKRLHDEMIAAIKESVLPAYVHFAAFVRDEYAPKGRTEPGMWSLPEGDLRYALAVRRSTTTDLTPEAIHQLGLAQVKELEGQMLVLAKKLGFSDLKTLNASLDKNPKLHAQSRQQILDLYKGYIDQMWPKLPQLFGRLPKAKLEVLPVEEFREKEASDASYDTGSPDGSRPGRVWVNTSNPQERKIITAEDTAYHEGVPGHHLQLSIAQELPSLPPFRQQGGYTAFVEGWALYSERLGKEVGFYQDPYSDYGRLQDEMLRAIRLVVDTGFHYKRWTRDQVVQFFHDHSAQDEVGVQSETDRYIVWPGQALGYKIGQLKILELRVRAEKALGAKFDIRKFHDEVLGAGALPLDVLERRIDSWIAAQKK
jgi:uncharacterized protein (DUF885 family)